MPAQTFSAIAPRRRSRWPSASAPPSIPCSTGRRRRSGRALLCTAGIVHVEQPAEAIEAVRAAVAAFDDPVALAALSVVTTLTGSAVLALAVARGRLAAEEAWRIAHVDEDFQIERWGEDEEAKARRAARWREMEAAASVLGALRRN